MKKINKVTRRSFLRKSSLGLGLGVAGGSKFNSAFAGNIKPFDEKNRLPREVWIASLTIEGLHPKTYKEMIKKVLMRMDEVLVYQPDIVCLPESFPYSDMYNGIQTPANSSLRCRNNH